MKATALGVFALLVAATYAHKDANDFKCDACTIGFQVIDDFLEMNLTQDYIEWGIGQLCELMPEPYKSACHDVVNADVKEIIALVKDIENPTEVCCQIGACPGVCPVPDAGCEICKFLMTDLERWVHENKTEAEIEHLIDSICLLMPSSWQPTCKAITDKDVHDLIELVLKFENPKVVCDQITLCDGSDMSSMIEFGCEACQMLFNALEKWVSMNYTETEIEKLLEYVCMILPESDKGICYKVIDYGVKELIEILKNAEDPYVICQQIGACKGPDPVTKPCHVCLYLFGSIIDYLSEGQTIEEIKSHVDEMCWAMGEDWKEVCDVVNKVTVEKVVAMLQQLGSADAACKQLAICA